MSDFCAKCVDFPHFDYERGRIEGNNYDIVTLQFSCGCGAITSVKTITEGHYDGTINTDSPARCGT